MKTVKEIVEHSRPDSLISLPHEYRQAVAAFEAMAALNPPDLNKIIRDNVKACEDKLVEET